MSVLYVTMATHKVLGGEPGLGWEVGREHFPAVKTGLKNFWLVHNFG